MDKNERQAYLKAIRSRYRRAPRKSKTVILDEYCAVCDYHRKYAIKLLRQSGRPRTQRRAGRPTIYPSAMLLTALKRIWFASDQMCSKKLKAALPLWLPFYDMTYEPLTTDNNVQLLGNSHATIDRLLKPVRARATRNGLRGTRPGSLLKNQIPNRATWRPIPWRIAVIASSAILLGP